MKNKLSFLAIIGLLLSGLLSSCSLLPNMLPRSDSSSNYIISDDKSSSKTSSRHSHYWSDWQVTKEATCLQSGTKQRYCHDCKEVEENVIPPLGHNWTIIANKEASCLEDGYMVQRCLVCGEERTEIIPTTGHNCTLIDYHAPSGEEADIHVYSCVNCQETFFNLNVSQVTEASKESLVFKADDTGEVSAQFWGRPIGNALALNDEGYSVHQINDECFYSSTETGDYFEFIFSLSEKQASKLANCRLYCDARPADYLDYHNDFWAYTSTSEDWTPGFYIDGADNHVQKNEDGTVMMVKDHARPVREPDGSEPQGAELEKEVKMGARIDDYRYLLYVDDVVQEFDKETEVPLSGSGTSMVRKEYVLPYTFHLHAGTNKVRLHMAGGYKSTFYNFTFRTYVEPTPLDVTTNKIEIRQGETAKIENVSMTNLIYTSKNQNVATVDEKGVVTGVNVGTTTIIVTKNGNYKRVKIPVTINEKFGVVRFEAEKEGFTSDPEGAVQAGRLSQWGSTMGIATFPQDATYTVKFNAELAGKFDLTMNAMGSFEDLSTVMSVKINNVDVTVSGALNAQWFASTVTFGQADLVVGENTLVIKALGESMPKIDYFKFVPAE